MSIKGNDKGNRLEGTRKADAIFGLGGNDKISGHQGDDKIDGGSGNDTIGGGQGHDTMIGGPGKDTFIFRHLGSSDSDTVTDFKHGTDKLAFDHATFDALDAGSLPSSAVHAGTKAHDEDDHFIYDKKSGKLYYDDDGIGPHGQHLVATLTNHPNLSAADFLLL